MLKRVNGVINWVEGGSMGKHSAIMIAFGLLGSFFNYLYQLSMGRLLTPTQYGTLYSLVCLFVIISVFSTSIETSITKFTSKFNAEGKPGRINYLWRLCLKRTLLLGLAVFLALAVLTPLISRSLNIENNWYALVLFSSLILAFALPVNYGMLNGLQRFLPLGFSLTLSPFIKLAIGTLLVFLGFGVLGGVLSIFIASVAVFAVTLAFLKNVANADNEKFEIKGLSQYFGLALPALAAFSVLINIDAVLVKHYLSPQNAGYYSAISVLGKIALYATSGIAIVMFPKTSELFESGLPHRPVFLKAILFTIILSGAIVIIYRLFPDFIVNFVFKGKYDFAIPHLFKYSLAMFFFSISVITLNYLLSVNCTKVAYPLVGAILVELVLIYFFHSNIGQIVNVMLISGIAAVVLMFPLYLRAG